MILYQCYTSGRLNDWKEISLAEFKKKFPNKEPRFKDKFSLISQRNIDYYIDEFNVSEVFYDHLKDEFVYIIPGGQVREDVMHASRDSAIEFLNSFEGTVKLLIPVGNGNYHEKILEYGPKTKTKN